MKKKIISSFLVTLMIVGSSSFSAFATMANGSVVIGSKSFDLAYANDPTNAAVIADAIVAGGAIYVKDFSGNWIDNTTGKIVDASIIPGENGGQAVTSVSTINITKNIGDACTLPTTVTATLSDGTTKNLAVTWDKQSVAWNNQPDTRQAGKFTFNGIVSGYSGTVVLTLNVYENMSSILIPKYYFYGLNTNYLMTTEGISYWNGYQFDTYPTAEGSFDLGGKYNHISADIGVDDNSLCDSNGNISLTVYGDGIILVPTYSLFHRGVRQALELDVTGVKELKFVKSGSGYLDIINPGIN
ncbi:Ig-like domain-containing protein [Clostridium estertheticum]|uniref:Ig-like domain-containing protein n=1 Tax=Clostridium estertheticum TaxID=238834 RepID=UPI001C6F4239|nr:Ig-like domain-containing protein [Clostridium estertheticum]MBW9172495.1 Ig-like domain-containing protein [Clostridium estertheticum]WLC76546.1 Ig-like domain-containing protein [Clostridium estertheticum]